MADQIHHSQSEHSKSRFDISRWLPWLVIGGVWLWFCGPMMCGQTVVGFRDSAYLYFPMFEAIDAAWAQGKVPLWNPFCNFGMPLVADGTSSVFYPGKVIFAARSLSYASRYGIYLGLHVLWSAVGTYWLARAMRCHRSGATIAAIAFAFGAPVVFQTTNVIYLVSASWLPIAVLGVWRFLKTQKIVWSLLAAVACAMMILGGDPQMVYHVGLIAAASIAWSGFCLAIGLIKRSPNAKQNLRNFSLQIVCLLCMIVATTLMAAIQLWPTAQLATRSERAEQNHAVNLYSTFQQDESGQRKPLEPLFQNSDVIVGQYEFSLPPWSLIEMIAPNVSGKPFPVNARWSDCLPAGDRMWYPSLYIGLVTLLLAVGQIRLWGQNKTNVWASWILLVFLLGSFGWYGLMWLWHELDGIQPSDDQWAAPVGGVYWLMSVLLPKFFVFRYPAKLFVVASLFFCVLAGRGIGPEHWLKRLNTKSIVVTFIAIAGIGVFLIWGSSAVKQLPGDSLNAMTMFGPFQTNEAIAQVYFSLAHLFVLSGLIWIACRMQTGGLTSSAPLPASTSNRSARSHTETTAWCLVALTAVDLMVANHWLLAEIPASVYEKEVSLAAELRLPEDENESDTGQRKKTLFASGYMPLEFATQTSKNRLAEIADWQRQTLQPRHHLNRKTRLVGSFHSIWPQHYQRFIEGYLDDLQTAFRSGKDWESDPSFLLDEHGEEVPTLYAIAGERDDLRITALNVSFDSALQTGLMNLLAIENPRVTIEDEFLDWNETRFLLLTHRPLGDEWLELPVLFDDDWQVTARFASASPASDFASVPVRASRRDLLQIHLPNRAGRYEVALAYEPAWFWWTVGISGCSWLVVAGWSFILLVTTRNNACSSASNTKAIHAQPRPKS